MLPAIGNPSVEWALCFCVSFDPISGLPILGYAILPQSARMMTDSDDARVVMIGSVTGNDNTVGGGGVYPIADLKEPTWLFTGFLHHI